MSPEISENFERGKTKYYLENPTDSTAFRQELPDIVAAASAGPLIIQSNLKYDEAANNEGKIETLFHIPEGATSEEIEALYEAWNN